LEHDYTKQCFAPYQRLGPNLTQ